MKNNSKVDQRRHSSSVLTKVVDIAYSQVNKASIQDFQKIIKDKKAYQAYH